jgi:hypothetical protein
VRSQPDRSEDRDEVGVRAAKPGGKR